MTVNRMLWWTGIGLLILGLWLIALATAVQAWPIVYVTLGSVFFIGYWLKRLSDSSK